uniref:NACHT domain-containing protein n=1 Tax=Eptatretus burgeri TaxID=7764 RepID=A0A8C4RB35_EPTBU
MKCTWYLFFSDVPKECLPHFEAESGEATKRIEDLKQRLRAAGLVQRNPYSACWGRQTQAGPATIGLEEFGRMVLDDLGQALDRMATEMGSEDMGESEKQLCFVQCRAPEGAIRHVLVPSTIKQLEGRQPRLLLLRGKRGSGKTSFLAHLVHRLQEEVNIPHVPASHCPLVFFYFVEATGQSFCPSSMLKHLSNVLRKGCNPDFPTESTNGDLIHTFWALLSQTAQAAHPHHVTLVIDGADSSNVTRQALDWIPVKLPLGVHLIVSATEGSVLDQAVMKQQPLVVQLSRLRLRERAELVRQGLARYHKTLDESSFNNQMQLVLGKRGGAEPRFLQLVCEELRFFGHFEKLTSKIAELGQTIPELLQQVLWRLEDELGQDLVRRALLSLFCCHDGLSEVTLHHVISLGANVDSKEEAVAWIDLVEAARRAEGVLPSTLFSRLLCSLKCFLGEGVSGWLPKLQGDIADAVRVRYLLKGGAKRETHCLIAAHFFASVFPLPGSCLSPLPEALLQLPQHLVSAGEFAQLGVLLISLPFLAMKCQVCSPLYLLEDFQLYESNVKKLPREARASFPDVSAFQTFLGENAHELAQLQAQAPCLFWQHALNTARDSPVAHRVSQLLGLESSSTVTRPQELHRALSKSHEQAGQGHSRTGASLEKGEVKWLLEWLNRPQESKTTSRVLTRVHDGATCMALSPGGTILALGCSDGCVCILKANTGQDVCRLQVHGDGVSACCFTSESALCVASPSGVLSCWDVQAFRLWEVKAHEDRITSCSICPNGDFLASCAWDGNVKVWRVSGGNLHAEFSVSRPLSCVSWCPQSRMLIAGSWDGTLTLWDTTYMQKTAVLSGHKAAVCSSAFDPFSRLIATSSLDGEIRLWSLEKACLIGTFMGHQGPVNALTFGPDGRWLISAGQDCKVTVWSGGLGRPVMEFEGGKQTRLRRVLCMAVKDDGGWLACGYHTGDVCLFNTETGTEIRAPKQRRAVLALAWLANGLLIAGVEVGQIIVFWTSPTAVTMINELDVDRVSVLALATSKTHVASGTVDGRVRMWLANVLDMSRRSPLTAYAELHKHTDAVTCCRFSPNGVLLLTGGRDMSLCVWDIQQSVLQFHVIPAHRDWLTSCAWSQDAKYVITCSNDHTVKIWDASSGELERELQGHQAAVTSVDCQLDYLVTSGADGELRMWSLQGLELATIPGNGQRMNCCCFFPLPPEKEKKGTVMSSAAESDVGRKASDVSSKEEEEEEMVLGEEGEGVVEGEGEVEEAEEEADEEEEEEEEEVEEENKEDERESEDGEQDEHSEGSEEDVMGSDVEQNDKEPVSQPEEPPLSCGELRVFCGSDDEKIRLWKPLQACEIASLVGHSAPVLDLEVGSQPGQIYSLDAGGQLREWTVTAGSGDVGDHTSAVTTIAVSPKGTCVVTGSQAGELHVWRNITDPSNISSFSLRVHQEAVQQICFLKCKNDELEEEFLSAGLDGRVCGFKALYQGQPCLNRLFELEVQNPLTCLLIPEVPGVGDERRVVLAGDIYGKVHCIVVPEGRLDCSFDLSPEDWIEVMVQIGDRQVLVFGVKSPGEASVFILEWSGQNWEKVSGPPVVLELHGDAWLSTVTSAPGPEGNMQVLLGDSLGQIGWLPSAYLDGHSHDTVKWNKVHQKGLSCVQKMDDVLATASWDRSLYIWAQTNLQLVGAFWCQAPVCSLMAAMSPHRLIICGDVLGRVYFLTPHCFSL